MRAQQEEYNQALAIDREKAAEKKRQENVEQEERRKAKEQLERLEARSARLKQRRIEIAQKMTQDIEAVQNEQELIRIRVSFPNGAKLERRFIIQESLEV
jgi:ribosomal protein L9